MLTRQQLLHLEGRCQYLSIRTTECPQYREFMSSLQLFGSFGDPHCASCRLQKAIPVHTERYFRLFLMHHLSNGSLDGGVTWGGMPMETHFGGIQQCVAQAKAQPAAVHEASELTVCRNIVVDKTGVLDRIERPEE